MRNTYLDFLAPAGANLKQAACSLCVVDISGSMEMPDYPPTRLKAAIMAIEAMLREKIRLRSHDKMGIVGFSHKGIRICPLTKVSDGQRILRSLKYLQTLGSTNFVEGLGLAQEMFEEEAGIRQRKPGFLQLLSGKSKATRHRITEFVPHAIFLSDGEHNEDSDPILAANNLRQSGVLLDCIGIGGSPADVDEDCLRAMASTGPNGKPRYRFIGDSQALIQDFRRMATLQMV